jgi:GDP-4-dehydro-6-deoxy-D-mannose reductase
LVPEVTGYIRRALVTGAEGFLGRHLVRELERHGAWVTGLARCAGTGSRHIEIGDAPWQAEHLAQIVRGVEPDVVFHLAGGATGTAEQLETLNVGLACTMMEALSLAEARPLFVCCGSAAEYGDAVIDGTPTPEVAACTPLGAYGASKFAQTQAALAFGAATGTRVLVARIFNPIGPGMPAHLALGEFARQIAALPSCGGVLRTGTLDVARDFIDIELVARALSLLARQPTVNGVVNICSGRATRLAHLVEMLIAASGKAVRTELDPERVRPRELQAIYGDPDLLWRLAGRLPETDYPAVMMRIWRDVEARAARGSQWAV